VSFSSTLSNNCLTLKAKAPRSSETLEATHKSLLRYVSEGLNRQKCPDRSTASVYQIVNEFQVKVFLLFVVQPAAFCPEVLQSFLCH
jgi:hypothetical protein